MRLLLLNGPNLNLLGIRDPETYGSETLADVEDRCAVLAQELGHDLDVFQSNHEGELIDRLHAAMADSDGIMFNPGAYTHTSYALHDAIEAIGVPTVEVHISNVHEREAWRAESRVGPACIKTIYGRGTDGYEWAIRHLHHRAAFDVETLSYGDDAEQVGDLRLPEGDGPFPVAVVLHGGLWQHQWTRDTAEAIAIDLTERGVATWLPEYRRVGRGGGAKKTIADVRAAVGHLASVEAPLDLARVGIIGHSAGGHLSLLASSGDGPVTPVVVVALAPITDLDAVRPARRDAVEAFAGSGPNREYSPIGSVPLGVDTVVVHGAADETVSVAQSDSYVAEAEAAGDEVEYHRLEGVKHGTVVEPSSAAWAVARRSLLDRLS